MKVLPGKVTWIEGGAGIGKLRIERIRAAFGTVILTEHDHSTVLVMKKPSR